MHDVVMLAGSLSIQKSKVLTVSNLWIMLDQVIWLHLAIEKVVTLQKLKMYFLERQNDLEVTFL